MARVEVPYTTKPQTRPTGQPLEYLRGAEVDYTGITRGLSALADGLGSLGATVSNVAQREAARRRVEEEQVKRSKFLVDMDNWRGGVDELFFQYQTGLDPTDANAEERWRTTYDDKTNMFRSGLTDPIQVAEFNQQASGWGIAYDAKLREFQQGQRSVYGETVINERLDSSKKRLKYETNFDTLLKEEEAMDEIIDLQTNVPPALRDAKKKEARRQLEGIMYGQDEAETGGFRPTDPNTPPEAPGMITPPTIDLTTRRRKEADGRPRGPINTDSITVQDGDQYAVIPTYTPDGKLMTDEEAEERYDKTGEHFGKFSTDAQAVEYSEKLESWSNRRFEGKPFYEPGSIQSSIEKYAKKFGLRPLEVAALLSYESSGTFSTSKWGGTGMDYLGIFQAGRLIREKYGVYPGQPFEEQMEAFFRYATDAGFIPGKHTLLDLYSTVNAGKPGRNDWSDDGGKTTVAARVLQMIDPNDWRNIKAVQLMRGEIDPNGIDKDPRYANLPYEDRLAIKEKVAIEKNNQAAQDQKDLDAHDAEARNRLMTGIIDGTHDKRDIDYARKVGLLNNPDDYEKALNLYKKYQEDAMSGARTAARVANGEKLDPANEKDRQGLNDWIGEIGERAVESMDDAYVDNELIPNIEKTGDIATRISGALNIMARSNKVIEASWALQTLGKLAEANQAAFLRRTDDKLQADVAFYQANKGAIPDEDLMAYINGTNMTEPQLKHMNTLKEQAAEIIKRGDVLASSVFAEWGFDPDTPQLAWLTPQFNSDFNEIFKYEYSRWGNRENAYEATVNRMKTVYGVTTVGTHGGRGYIMKYPPELAGYTPGADGFSYMEREIRNSFGIPDDVAFQLVGTEQTYADKVKFAYDKTGKVKPPAYLIVMQFADGSYQLVQRYRPANFDPVAGYKSDQPYAGITLGFPVLQPVPFYFTKNDLEVEYESAAQGLKNAENIRNDYLGGTWIPAEQEARAKDPINPERLIPPDIQAQMSEYNADYEVAKIRHAKAKTAAEARLPPTGDLQKVLEEGGFTQPKELREETEESTRKKENERKWQEYYKKRGRTGPL